MFTKFLTTGREPEIEPIGSASIDGEVKNNNIETDLVKFTNENHFKPDSKKDLVTSEPDRSNESKTSSENNNINHENNSNPPRSDMKNLSPECQCTDQRQSPVLNKKGLLRIAESQAKSRSASSDTETDDGELPSALPIPPHGFSHAPKLPHPLLPYFYYSNGLLPFGFPFNTGDNLPNGIEPIMARLHRFQIGATGFKPNGDVTTDNNISSHLALASYSPFWYQYYTAALSQATADSAAAVLGTASSTNSPPGPVLPSRSLSNTRISPYGLTPPHISKLTGLPAPIPITPAALQLHRDDHNRSPQRRSPDSSSSPSRIAPGPVGLIAAATAGSQLQNMQNMVSGLEKQQQQIVTDSLTKLEP